MKSWKFKLISKLDFSDETMKWLEWRIFRLWKVVWNKRIYYIQIVKVCFYVFLGLLKVSPKKCHHIKCLLYVFSKESSGVKGSSKCCLHTHPDFGQIYFYGFPWLVTFLPIGLRLLIALYLVAKLTVVNAVATLQRDLSSLVNPLE